ncbi:uncharacterized protein LOC123306951 [Coccinella septempunctata]|uniref:uncharacterized protein LOC123306951 n=1 Tax=Coccinella septempunctata TaxID=41139 RepID=UPI001D060D9C|nr:uncharacterized protein LOC123306951 [Coccinella septempunctata]
MIPKKGDPTQPKNYRPITCLPAVYKILTSTISHKINNHIDNNNIMSPEQNGCRQKARGSKELLIIDNTITKQAKKRLKNISVAWIDYQKAFDSVPHSWLLEILRIYKVDHEVVELLKSLMSTWRTCLTWNKKSSSTPIKIKRGIFQGDGLSPSWFCLALNPLSNILNRAAYSYSMDSQNKVSHLFYLDDLKLFSRGQKQLEGQLELVRKFSEDIGMIFGLEKCAVVNVRRGRLAEGENVELSDGRTVPILGQEERYKYLGIQQTFGIRQQENKMETERELIRRVRRIMNTQLSAKNKMEAINIWAVPVFAYTAGILIWSKSDLEKLDRKIRSILTQYGTLHPNSAIERLYLPRKEGGRGLSNLQDIYLKEEKKIKNYFQTGITPIQKWVASQRYPSSGETSTHEPEIEDFKEILKQNWQTKPLHGRFFASLNQSDVDKLSSSTYLTQGYLFPQTEGTFLAIQDQVVPTRVYTKHIMKQQVQTTKCRLCDKAEETVQHLSSGCSTIAGTKYLGRHDNMGKVVHQSLCLREQLLPHFVPHHIYAPQTVLENETTNNIKLIPKPEFKIDRLHSRIKDSVSTFHKSGVIYSVPCSMCNEIYIGQTSQQLKKRLAQHRSDIKNPNKICALADHSRDRDHLMDYEATRVLDCERNGGKRSFLEMYHIKRHPNAMNYRRDVNHISSIYSYLIHFDQVNEGDPSRPRSVSSDGVLSDGSRSGIG